MKSNFFLLTFSLALTLPFQAKAFLEKAKKEIWKLEFKNGQKAKVLLASTKIARKHVKNYRKNCYAYASASYRHVPGGVKDSPVERPYNVNIPNLIAALQMDHAIFLGGLNEDLLEEHGRNLKLNSTIIENAKKIDINKYHPDQLFTLVAAMWGGEEYHFVRAFADGWWSKPSKTGVGGKLMDRFRHKTVGGKKTTFDYVKDAGIGTLGKIISLESTKAKNHLGFFLLPYKLIKMPLEEEE